MTVWEESAQAEGTTSVKALRWVYYPVCLRTINEASYQEANKQMVLRQERNQRGHTGFVQTLVLAPGLMGSYQVFGQKGDLVGF